MVFLKNTKNTLFCSKKHDKNNFYLFVYFIFILFQIPGYMKGYNYRNETINLPPYEIMPPVLEGYDSHEPAGNFYTITGEWIPL